MAERPMLPKDFMKHTKPLKGETVAVIDPRDGKVKLAQLEGNVATLWDTGEESKIAWDKEEQDDHPIDE